MNILFLEPFFGGSHKNFARGFQEHSRHRVKLVTLPARFWKWRMRGAAPAFVEKIKDIGTYDAVFATDMMDLTDFTGLAGQDLPPILFYFHESQLSYPLAPGEKRDFHLGFTNIISAAAADAVMFNSRFHFNAFCADAEALFKKLPDLKPGYLLEKIREKTTVAYPGCRFGAGPVKRIVEDTEPPLIIWNHRWEHDKNPEMFFSVLAELKKKDVRFSLAVLGERFESVPPVFKRAEKEFRRETRVFGYADTRQAYVSWLEKGAVVVSCATQENFGISVVEAVRCGCFPLLPARLAYPELIPKAMHGKCLYKTRQELVDKLAGILVHPEKYRTDRQRLSMDMEKFAWIIRVKQYDSALEDLRKFP